jgi:catechol 2,3-dioxygenase-like lactoylglutathione lyase family enzyme
MKFTLDSVLFNSHRLSEVRAFYEEKLGFPMGTFQKDGKTVPDFSETYVNYHLGDVLVGFEIEDEAAKAGVGDLVLRVSEFEAFKSQVKQAGIPIEKEGPFFFMIHDPEGRSLIFEPAR